MDDSRDDPIRSLRFDDPDLEERLDAFVVALGEQIDLIQEAERTGEWQELAARAEALAGEAESLGFPPLDRAARHAALLSKQGNPADTRKGVVDLTDVVRRVRLGHRALP